MSDDDSGGGNDSTALVDRLEGLVSSSDDGEDSDESDDANGGAAPAPAAAGLSMRERLAAALADNDDEDEDNDDVEDDITEAHDRVDFNLGSPHTVATAAGSIMRMSPLTLDDKTDDTAGLSTLNGDDDDDDGGGGGGGDEGGPMYTAEHLAGLPQSQLRRLARDHKVALSGGRDAIEQRLRQLRGTAPPPAADTGPGGRRARPAREHQPPPGVRLDESSLSAGGGARAFRRGGGSTARERRRGRSPEPDTSDGGENSESDGGDDDGGGGGVRGGGNVAGDSSVDIRMLTDTDADGSADGRGGLTEDTDSVDLRMLVSGSEDDASLAARAGRGGAGRGEARRDGPARHDEADDDTDSGSNDDDADEDDEDDEEDAIDARARAVPRIVTALGRADEGRALRTDTIFTARELLSAWAVFDDRGRGRLDLVRHKLHLHLLDMLQQRLGAGPVARVSASKARAWVSAVLPRLIAVDTTAAGLRAQKNGARKFAGHLRDLNGGRLRDPEDSEDSVGGDGGDSAVVGKGVFVEHAEEALLLLAHDEEASGDSSGGGGGVAADDDDVEAQVEAALAAIQAKEDAATNRAGGKDGGSQLDEAEEDDDDDDNDDDEKGEEEAGQEGDDDGDEEDEDESEDDEVPALPEASQSSDGDGDLGQSNDQDGLLSSAANSVRSPAPSVQEALQARAERQGEFEALLREHSHRLERIEAVSYGDALHQKMQQEERDSERRARLGRGRRVYFDDDNPAPPGATLLGGDGDGDGGGDGPLRLSHMSTARRDQERLGAGLRRYDAFGAGNLDFAPGQRRSEGSAAAGRPLGLSPDQWARSRGARPWRRSRSHSPPDRGVAAVGVSATGGGGRGSSSKGPRGTNLQAAAVASAVIQADVQRTLGMTGDLRSTVVSLTQQLERMTAANQELGDRCAELERARDRTKTESTTMASNAQRLFERNQKDLEALAVQHQDTVAENTRLHDELDELRGRAARDTAARDTTIRRLEGELEEARAEVHAAKVDADVARRQLATAAAQHDAAAAEEAAGHRHVVEQIEAERAALEARVQRKEEALHSEEALKAMVVAELERAHRDELAQLKERDFEAQNQLAKKNSEIVVAKAELQILRERLRVAKQELELMHEGAASHYARQRQLQDKLDQQTASSPRSQALTAAASSPRSAELVALRRQVQALQARVDGGAAGSPGGSGSASPAGGSSDRELARAQRENRALERENEALRLRLDSDGSQSNGSPTGAAAMREIVNELRAKLARAEGELKMRRQEARVLREALVRKLERGRADLDITAQPSFDDASDAGGGGGGGGRESRRTLSTRRRQALDRVAERKRQQQQQQQQRRRQEQRQLRRRPGNASSHGGGSGGRVTVRITSPRRSGGGGEARGEARQEPASTRRRGRH